MFVITDRWWEEGEREGKQKELFTIYILLFALLEFPL